MFIFLGCKAKFPLCDETQALDIGCSMNQQRFSIKQTCLLAGEISSSWVISPLLIYRLQILERIDAESLPHLSSVAGRLRGASSPR